MSKHFFSAYATGRHRSQGFSSIGWQPCELTSLFSRFNRTPKIGNAFAPSVNISMQVWWVLIKWLTAHSYIIFMMYLNFLTCIQRTKYLVNATHVIIWEKIMLQKSFADWSIFFGSESPWEPSTSVKQIANIRVAKSFSNASNLVLVNLLVNQIALLYVGFSEKKNKLFNGYILARCRHWPE